VERAHPVAGRYEITLVRCDLIQYRGPGRVLDEAAHLGDAAEQRLIDDEVGVARLEGGPREETTLTPTRRAASSSRAVRGTSLVRATSAWNIAAKAPSAPMMSDWKSTAMIAVR